MNMKDIVSTVIKTYPDASGVDKYMIDLFLRTERGEYVTLTFASYDRAEIEKLEVSTHE